MAGPRRVNRGGRTLPDLHDRERAGTDRSPGAAAGAGMTEGTLGPPPGAAGAGEMPPPGAGPPGREGGLLLLAVLLEPALGRGPRLAGAAEHGIGEELAPEPAALGLGVHPAEWETDLPAFGALGAHPDDPAQAGPPVRGSGRTKRKYGAAAPGEQAPRPKSGLGGPETGHDPGPAVPRGRRPARRPRGGRRAAPCMPDRPVQWAAAASTGASSACRQRGGAPGGGGLGPRSGRGTDRKGTPL